MALRPESLLVTRRQGAVLRRQFTGGHRELGVTAEEV